jgi:hypothetical protein
VWGPEHEAIRVALRIRRFSVLRFGVLRIEALFVWAFASNRSNRSERLKRSKAASH